MAKSPDAFRTISEVSDWLGVPPHVLRFWETKFTQVKPVKRAGGRRYYRPADMALLGGIRQLLHDDGMTIRGVQKILRERGVRHVADMGSSDAQETEAQQGAQTQEAEARKVNGVDLPSVRADEPRPSEPANVTPEGEGAPPAREAAVPEVPAPVASGPPTTGFVAAVVLRKRDRDLDADARTAFGALRARLLEIRARLDQ